MRRNKTWNELKNEVKSFEKFCLGTTFFVKGKLFKNPSQLPEHLQRMAC